MKSVFIVTGASRGIGAETVKALRALGKEVVATSRTSEDPFWELDVNHDASIAAFV